MALNVMGCIIMASAALSLFLRLDGGTRTRKSNNNTAATVDLRGGSGVDGREDDENDHLAAEVY
jgi:hypothetical protein